MYNETSTASAPSIWQNGHIASGLALAALLIVLIAPRSTPAMLFLLAVPIIALGSSFPRIEMGPLPHLVTGLAVLSAYLFLNALWSVDPIEGLGKAALFALIVAVVASVATVLPSLSQENVRHVQRGMLLAVGIGIVFLAIETPLGQPVRRFVTSVLPFLRPPAKHMAVDGGWVTRINLYTLNRNLGIFSFVLWPTLLMLRSYLPVLTARAAASALLALTALAVFNSEHETSMIALVAGCLVFAGTTFAPRTMQGLVLAGWVAATLLVVPIAAISYDAGLHRASWLPGTARNRIILWDVTADKMRDAPYLGIGIGSTKPLDEEAAATAPRLAGDAYPQRTGRHAHNIFMQTWYELGAMGALCLLAVGMLALRALSRLPDRDQPYAYAAFVSAMVIASFTWGMWQPWFMAAFGIWAITLLVALDTARRSQGLQEE